MKAERFLPRGYGSLAGKFFLVIAQVLKDPIDNPPDLPLHFVNVSLALGKKHPTCLDALADVSFDLPRSESVPKGFRLVSVFWIMLENRHWSIRLQAFFSLVIRG
jgi:hypothetical protein